MGTSILIIEKDEPGLRLMEWGLREEGFDVSTVTGPVDASAELRPDVIVLNTGMAMASKRLWIESLRYIVPGVKIVDLIAGAELHDAYDSGADAYLQQPFRLDNLNAILVNILGRELGNTPRALESETSDID